MGPLAAARVLGAIRGLWYLRTFLLSGTPQANRDFLPFVEGAIAISVIVTPIFNADRGSILLPMLFHWQINNPAWPDAQPYDTVFSVAATIAEMWAYRSSMFTRNGAAMEVISGRRGSEHVEAAEGL